MQPLVVGNNKVFLEYNQCHNSAELPPGESVLYPGGEYDGYEQCWTHPANDPVAIEKCVIDREIKLHPTEVGAPVSVLEISLLGSNWKYRGIYAQIHRLKDRRLRRSRDATLSSPRIVERQARWRLFSELSRRCDSSDRV